MTKARDIANAGTALSSVDATELGYLDGVTSNIQTQFSNISGSKAQPTEPSSPTDGMIWVDTDGSTTDANFIPKTLTSTTGDIIYASSANTPARLGIGSTSQVLTVSGGVPTWAAPAAAGMTSLATGSLNSLSTLDLTSISQSYIHLQLILLDWELSADSNVYLRINNESQNYYFESGRRGTNTSGGTTTTAFFTKNTDSLVYLTGGQADAGNYRNSTIVNIYNYTQTVFAFGDIKSQSRLASGDDEVFDAQWSYDRTTNNAPITEVNLLLDTGNFSNGTYVLYGVK